MPRSYLTDYMWDKLAPLLPPERGKTGRPSKNHRNMIEAILWKHRTGAPWRDLPEEFGPWISVFTRFNRWSKVGLWQTSPVLALQTRPRSSQQPISSRRGEQGGGGSADPLESLPAKGISS